MKVDRWCPVEQEKTFVMGTSEERLVYKSYKELQKSMRKWRNSP